MLEDGAIMWFDKSHIRYSHEGTYQKLVVRCKLSNRRAENHQLASPNLNSFALNLSIFSFLLSGSAGAFTGIARVCRSTPKPSNCSPMRKEVY